jgi:hypothetical protein
MEHSISLKAPDSLKAPGENAPCKDLSYENASYENAPYKIVHVTAPSRCR